MWSIITATLSIIIAIILCQTYWFHTYWRRHGVKGPNLWRSLMSYSKVLMQSDWELYENYGNIIGFYEIFKRGLIVNEPKLIKDILVKDFHVFTNRRYYNGGRVFDSGLFLGRDQQWKRVRAVVSQAFTPLKLRAMFPQISKIADQFCDNIEDVSKQGSFDIKILINAFVNDVICSCNFGLPLDSLKTPDHDIVVNSRKFFEPDLGITNILGYVLPDVAKFLNFKVVDDKPVQYFQRLVTHLIQVRKEHDKTFGKVNRSDLLQFLIDANQDSTDSESHSNEHILEAKVNLIVFHKIHSTKRLSADETFATSMDFFLAGYGTTVCTLSHICYYMAKHQQYQQILFEELSQIYELEEESLTECKYLNAVIKETLRISPVSGRYDREAAQDYRLGDTGIVVPKGCLVTICPFTVHHNPKYYPSPNDFRPDRFLGDKQNSEEYSYLSWGFGPRMCVGMNFALNEIRIFVYELFTRYRLTLPHDYQLEYPKGNLINMPSKVKVLATNRSDLISDCGSD